MAGVLKLGSRDGPIQLRLQRRARLMRAARSRWRHRLRRLVRAVVASSLILLAALAAGLFIDGIGIEAVLFGLFVIPAIFILLLLIFPRTPAPQAEDLHSTQLPELAETAVAWLETQRGLLPSRAQSKVDLIASRLDDLAPQMAMLGSDQAAASEARRLLGEHLPAIIGGYTRIPASLRREPHAGSTPEAQLVEGLDVISGEIDDFTRRIARRELDELAIRGRYLETRYSDGSVGARD
jgi:hypothetical protein